MNIQGINVQDFNRGINHRNIKNVSEAMSQAREKLASVQRDKHTTSNHIDLFGFAEEIELNDSFSISSSFTIGQSTWSNVQALKSDSNFRSNVMHSVKLYLAFGEDGWRTGDTNTISDMAEILQTKLEELNNDTQLTDEERSFLSAVWKEGFAKAVGFQLGFDVVDTSSTMSTGAGNLRDAEERIRYVVNDVTSSDFSPEIQNLILNGLDKMMEGPMFKGFLIKQRPLFPLAGGPNDHRNINVYMSKPKASDVDLFRSIVEAGRNQVNHSR